MLKEFHFCMFVFHARTVITVLENSIVILCHTGWWK